jgi:hypothetical protein
VPFWSYLASYNYGTPVLGMFHASDILMAYGITPGFASSSIQAYYISFINELYPNAGSLGLTKWPQWKEGKQLLNLKSLSNTPLTDDFRSQSYDVLASSMASLHFQFICINGYW